MFRPMKHMPISRGIEYMFYGYCRISTAKQNIERQIRNISAAYPDAKIITETYTGTKFQGRRELDKILQSIQPGDTIVFDSVSRMSRDAEEGFRLYESLFRKGINLIFLKEAHINTDTYKQSIESRIKLAINSGDKDMDLLMQGIVDALNTYILSLARKQIQLAFEQSEKEVRDLQQRTREGIETARRSGKQIGRKNGDRFGGNLKNNELAILAGISMGSLKKYKRQLIEEIESSSFHEIWKQYNQKQEENRGSQTHARKRKNG